MSLNFFNFTMYCGLNIRKQLIFDLLKGIYVFRNFLVLKYLFIFVKVKTKETALSSYRSYNNNLPQNLSKEEFIVLHNLSKNKYLIIQKSDKGSYVAIVKRQDYIKKMDDVLSDQKKFSKVSLKDDTLLNFAINQEKHVDKVLKKLVESKSTTENTSKS